MRISTPTAVRWTALFFALIALLWGAGIILRSHRGTAPVVAAELQPIPLPKPEITGGMPLMQALGARKTTRVFMDKPLPLQTLSNLLWAAFGINRSRGVKPGVGRTAPSAYNKQDITLEGRAGPRCVRIRRRAESVAPGAFGRCARRDQPGTRGSCGGHDSLRGSGQRQLRAGGYRVYRPECVPVCGVGGTERLRRTIPCARRTWLRSWGLAPTAAFSTRNRWGIRSSRPDFGFGRRLARVRRRVIESSVGEPDLEIIRTAGTELKMANSLLPPKSAT